MLLLSLRNLYEACECGQVHLSDTIPAYNYGISINELISHAILRSYQRKVTANKVDTDLWLANAKALTEAVFSGIPPDKQKYGSREHQLALNLRYNAHVLSAFKMHQQQADLAALLVDATGKPRTYAEFKKLALPIVGEYNKNHLKTEYNTAQAAARSAAKWVKFPDNSMLRFVAVKDDRTRDTHRALDGATYPKSHPFWNWHNTPLDWYCRCTIRQAPPEATEVPPASLPEIKPAFRNNPGKTGELFSKDHPYFDLDTEYAAAAAKFFGLAALMPIGPERLKANIALFNELMADSNWKLEATYNESGGFVFKHISTLKREDVANVPVGKVLAKDGYAVQVREWVNDGQKQPDYIINGILADLKTVKEVNAKNIDQVIRRGGQQGNWVILDLIEINAYALRAIQNRVRRKPNILFVSLIYKQKQITFSREEILNGGWKAVVKKIAGQP